MGLCSKKNGHKLFLFGEVIYRANSRKSWVQNQIGYLWRDSWEVMSLTISVTSFALLSHFPRMRGNEEIYYGKMENKRGIY